MAVADRLFSWQVGTLALYAYGDGDPDDVHSSPVYDLIAIFDSFKIRGETTGKHPGRATLEGNKWDLPYEVSYSIEVGAVVEGPTLRHILQTTGVGPYRLWFVNGDGTTEYARVFIGSTEHSSADGAQSQSMVFEVQGAITPGILGGGS